MVDESTGQYYLLVSVYHRYILYWHILSVHRKLSSQEERQHRSFQQVPQNNICDKALIRTGALEENKLTLLYSVKVGVGRRSGRMITEEHTLTHTKTHIVTYQNNVA